jgi:primosomal protein N'
MTKGLMVETAYYGQNQSSFSDASEMVKKALHININKETVRNVTEDIGRMVYEADTKKAEHVLENMHKIEEKPEKEKRGVLYIMTDGAAVNTRVKDENGSTWRENKTVIAFTDKDMIKRKDGSNIIVKKEYSAFIGSAERFKGYVLNTAINAGYGKTREVVIIGDGAAWIRNIGKEVFPEAVQILDLFHLKENIYNYAKYKFSYNEKDYVPWAESFIDKIEKGKADEALLLLPEEEKTPAGVVNLRTYINNNIDKINYPLYKEKGYFVGSGAIESANKVILQRRLKQAGMRWGVKGAQPILSLRAKVESNRWHSDVEHIFAA